jgi:hypothetical protein
VAYVPTIEAEVAALTQIKVEKNTSAAMAKTANRRKRPPPFDKIRPAFQAVLFYHNCLSKARLSGGEMPGCNFTCFFTELEL